VVSRRLWTVLIVSSVLVHFALLAILHANVRRASIAADDAPISIELLAEIDLDSPSTQTPPAVQASPPARAAAPTRPNPDAAPTAPPSDRLDTAIEPNQEIERQDDRPESTPTPTPTPATPPTTPATSPITRATPTPRSQETTPPVTPDASRQPPPSAPLEPDEPSRSGFRLPTPPDVRSVTPSGPEQAPPEVPTEQTRVSQNPIPAKYSASISNVTLPLEIPEIPENPAALREGDRTKTFQSDTSGCLLTPDVLGSFGQEVILNIVVDETGNIYTGTEPTVQKTSGNPSYDNLVVCAVKTWKFDPGYDTREGTRFYRPSDLQISVVIN
jgi:outer membrane biosynthesis protein TonB